VRKTSTWGAAVLTLRVPGLISDGKDTDEGDTAGYMDAESPPDNAITLEGAHCRLELSRPSEGVVLIVLKGSDIGEFGDAPFRELDRDLAAGLPIELFVDARKAPSASIEVSGSWARWMMANRERIQRFNICCQSRFIELTARFVQQFTEFGPRMRIYTDSAAFDDALRAAGGPLDDGAKFSRIS